MEACFALLPMFIIGAIVLLVVVPSITAGSNYQKLSSGGIPAQDPAHRCFGI